MGAIWAGSTEQFPTRGRAHRLHGYTRAGTGYPEARVKPSIHEILPGDPKEDAMRRWMQAQMQYENLADNGEVAERARTFCKQRKHWFEAQTHEVRDLWQALDFVLRGNSLARRFPDSDVHIPELHKVVETLVPRLEEALIPDQRFFTVHGRDRMDRLQAESIQYWLDYMLDLCKFADKLQPGLRAMVVYGFMAYKVWWDVEYRDQITRDVKKLDGRDNPTYRITPKHERKLAYEGVRLELIDPYNWRCDWKNADHQKGLFAGDTTLMTLDEIQRVGSMFGWQNIEELEDQEPKKGTYGTSRWAKIARKLDSADELFDHKRGPGQPKEFEVDDWWLKWEPVEGESAREFHIVMANDSTILYVGENPHDDKHRPYAVGRSQNSPFDWRNVGVLDQALRLQLELDDHENLADRAAANRQCPQVWVGPESDTPRNIFTAEVGDVWHTSQPPTFFISPATYSDYLMFKEDKRREIEETTGTPRLYQGQGSEGDTATEFTGRQKEANRRIRGLVRAGTHCIRQILEQSHQLSAQYVMTRKTYRVIGRAAKRIGAYAEIGPEELMDPVDFEFKGIEGLSELGLRATQMMTALNATAPILPGVVEDLDQTEFFDTIWTAMAGQELGEKVLRKQPNLEDVMPPDEEEMAMSQGEMIGIHPLDDHREHLESHWEDFARAIERGADEQEVKLKAQHISMHQGALKRQILQAQAQQQKQPFTAGSQETMSERPVGGRGIEGRQPDLFAPNQQAQNPPGELSGPPAAERIGSPDRATPFPQDANRY